MWRHTAPAAGSLATAILAYVLHGQFLVWIRRGPIRAPAPVPRSFARTGGRVLAGRCIGALTGRFLLSLFGLGANSLIGTFITAVIGACFLSAIVRAVSGSRTSS